MSIYTVTIRYEESTSYEVIADTKEEAVELAAERADDDGFETIGAFHVIETYALTKDQFLDEVRAFLKPGSFALAHRVQIVKEALSRYRVAKSNELDPEDHIDFLELIYSVPLSLLKARDLEGAQ